MKSTIKLLQEDFAHFGFPQTVVTDCAATFKSEEFQEFCKENGIVRLTEALSHPATNGATERLVQTFKQTLKKSAKPQKMRCKTFWEITCALRYQPVTRQANCLTWRQTRTKIDTLLPSPAQTAQGKQVKEATKSQQSECQLPVTQVAVTYKVSDPCCALYFGPRRDRDPRWVPCHCCQTFWDPQCQRACGSERSSLETPHRSTATTLSFARWHRTWWFSQVVRKQRREPLRFRAAPERHFDSDRRATADVTKR